MADAILTFTFGPVQSYISEARRASDLYVGSRTLVRLAQAAARAIQDGGGKLIFPKDIQATDTPNRIVARVSNPHGAAQAAEDALKAEWVTIAHTARQSFTAFNLRPDDTWDAIWQRQLNNHWEVYWAAAPVSAADNGEAYRQAFLTAGRALDGVKRLREFRHANEPGLKDTLSGRRQALLTARPGNYDTSLGEWDANAYWRRIGEQVKASKLRPGGRERLDAIGTIKRFSQMATIPFKSVSSVASSDFLALAKVKARRALAEYRDVLREFNDLWEVTGDPDWSHDGDFLYMETLTRERLDKDYKLDVDESQLRRMQATLRRLYDQVAARPSSYYAIIVLDGDSMGKHITELLEDSTPERAHIELSDKLADFARQVRRIVEDPPYYGTLIFNGGDDVLALAPLATAVPLAQALAQTFNEVVKVRGRILTASAGIAITHHLSPLSAALRTARDAEKKAKQMRGKAAVCVSVLRRSGEATDIRSHWTAMDYVDEARQTRNLFDDLVKLFADKALAGKFPYDVKRSAYGLFKADDPFESELKRLLTRHRDGSKSNAPDPATWATRLRTWAAALPNKSEELADWLVFARFVAQGGGE